MGLTALIACQSLEVITAQFNEQTVPIGTFRALSALFLRERLAMEIASER